MRKITKILFPTILGLSIIGASLALATNIKQINSKAEYIATSLFELNGLKAKTATSAAFNPMYSDTRKGLSLYSYGNGGTATYKNVLTSSISIDLKSSTLNQTSPNLYHYSIKFENVDNKEFFKLHIQDSGTSISYYVESEKGDSAAFYSQSETDWEARGYTKIANASSEYLTYEYSLAAESTYITFNPNDVSIYATCAKKQVKIWDFTSDYIDGKSQISFLSSMKRYQVSFEFEETKINAKSELVIYTIGDIDFSDSFLADDTRAIDADFSVKGLVGQEYKMPVPTNVDKDDIKVRIYSGTDIISDQPYNDTSFVPAEAKSYYVVYYTDDNSGWFKLDVESVASNNFVIDPSFDESSVGYMAEYTVPNCSIQSNLFDENVDAVVTIAKKGGEVLAEYKEVAPGFVFTFDELPGSEAITYTFTYSYKNENNTNFNYTKTYEKKVIKLNKTISMVEYDSLYAKNSTLTIHEALVYKDGNVYVPTYETTYPSGYKTSEENIQLTEAGYYTVTYSYGKGTFTRSFAAVKDVNSLFETTNTSGQFAYSSSNDKYCGYMASFKSNGSVIYNKKINVKDLTKDDCLIALAAQPKEMGTADLTTIIVTLTDANDSTNYINIRLRQGNDDMSNGTFIRAAAYNQDYAGYYFNPWLNDGEYVENSKAHEMGGFVHSHDFASTFGAYRTVEKNIVRLYYDSNEKSAYSEWDNHANTIYGSEHPVGQVSKTKFADFSSKECFTKTWNGFTSNEIILSVSAYGINGSSADVIITNIYGSDLSSEMIKDAEGPKVDIDKEGNNGYPIGVVGTRFNFLNATAEDEGSGVQEVTYKAYDPSRKEIDVSYDASNDRYYFIPTKAGTYKLQYAAKDNFNNVTKTDVEISVVESGNFNPLTISVQPYGDNYSLGETVLLPTPYVTGGAGYNKITKEVRFASKTGEKIECETGSFVAEKIGTYYLIFSVQDYLGNIAEDYYKINVTRSEVPLFDETSISMPISFVNDTTYKFPEYKATYYHDDDVSSKQILTGEIVISDGKGTFTVGEDGLYKPTYTKECPKASVSVVFHYGEGKQSTYGPYEVNIISANSGTKFLQGYFLSHNATLSVYPLFSQLEVDDPTLSASYVTFVRPVNEDIYSLELSSPYDADPENPSDNFQGLKITLKDAQNSSIVVDVNIRIGSDGSLLANVNNGEYTGIDGSLYSEVVSTNNVVISYDSSTHAIYDGLGGLIDYVETTVDGSAFTGFTSHEIYTTIEFVDFDGPSAIKVLSIGGQRINNTKRDATAPVLFVEGNYYGTFDFGQEIILPAATAYDVLSYCYNPTVTITYEDGTYAKDINGYVLNKADASEERTFIPEKYGTYEVTYSAEDEAGNSVSLVKNIIVQDTTVPTFKLNFEIGTSISSGTTLNLLDYTVKDNLDETAAIDVSIYLVLPNNMTEALRYKDHDGTVVTNEKLDNGRYKFTSKGHYRLLYLVSDSNGNTAVFTYYFDVK